MAYLNVVRIEEALFQMKEKFPQSNETETLLLEHAFGRFLSEDLYSSENLPAFRRSTVDGFAVLSSDTAGASEQAPILLENLGHVDMGMRAAQKLEAGYTLYVPTGGEIPSGADAMVMIEHTEPLGNDVAIFSTVRHGAHLVNIGEDVAEKTIILKKGTRLEPHHAAILASLGYAKIPVQKRIQVAVLSTGDELVDISRAPDHGQVRDCNAYIIRTAVEAQGGEIVYSNRLPDHFEALQNAVETALSRADVVLLSGGSSAGNKDMTQDVINHFADNSETPAVFIHGLAIKPGKPTIIGKVGGKAVIGLPGHPAACFITLKALVEPFLDYAVGHSSAAVKTVTCVANFQLYAASGRDLYQFVYLYHEDSILKADIIYGKSGMVSAMAQANAYVIIPMEHEGILKGDTLTAYLL